MEPDMSPITISILINLVSLIIGVSLFLMARKKDNREEMQEISDIKIDVAIIKERVNNHDQVLHKVDINIDKFDSKLDQIKDML